MAEGRKITPLVKILIGLQFLSLAFTAVGLYILFAPRWSQIGYSNLNWETFEGIYQYPKTQPYLMEILIPIIITLLATALILFVHLTRNTLLMHKTHGVTKLFGSLFLIGLFTAGTVTTVIGAPELEFLYYDSEPYLTWAPEQSTNTSITVCWHSALLTGSEVRYGISRNNLNRIATSDQFGRYHHVRINGLEPNTTYYYHVEGLRLDGKSYRLREFTTRPNGVFNFTFTVWADHRTNNPYSDAIQCPNVCEYISQHIEEQKQTEGFNYAFSLTVGDFTARGVDYQTWKLWLQDIASNDLASNTSHMVCLGNHERHDDNYRINFPKYYPIRASEPGAGLNFTDTSYSYDYGNVHFTLLDRWDYENPWWSSDDLAHASWLEQDLIAHSDAKFKILAIHPNPQLDPTYEDCTRIMEVARVYGVDAVFCGHWHMYRTDDLNGDSIVSTGSMNEIDNITMTIGIGGNSHNPANAGYCQVDVTEDTLTLRPRYIDGTWMDAFRITKP